MADRVQIAVQLRGNGRTDTLMGRSFRVVPATLVRAKVLNNNLGRTLLGADSITQEWADTANGAPVVVDHPSRRGSPTSARDPQVLNRTGAGFLFATKAENGALKGEVWLDMGSTERVEGMPGVFARLDAGEPVEVSTGFPVQIEERSGVENGEAFDRVIHPAGFDHLAIFADEKIGACSVQDGCGLAQNHDGPCDHANQEDDVDEETQGRLANVLDKLTAFLSRATPPEQETAEEPESPEEEAATNSDEGDSDMNREQMIAQLAQAGPLDREALNKLTDCQLQALAGANGGDEGATNQKGGDSAAWQVAHEYRRKFEELKEATKTAVENEEQERARLLDDCLYAENRGWGDDELEAMGIVELRKVHRTMFPPERAYHGRGGVRASSASGGDFTFVRDVLGPNSVLSEEVN